MYSLYKSIGRAGDIVHFTCKVWQKTGEIAYFHARFYQEKLCRRHPVIQNDLFLRGNLLHLPRAAPRVLSRLRAVILLAFPGSPDWRFVYSAFQNRDDKSVLLHRPIFLGQFHGQQSLLGKVHARQKGVADNDVDLHEDGGTLQRVHGAFPAAIRR